MIGAMLKRRGLFTNPVRTFLIRIPMATSLTEPPASPMMAMTSTSSRFRCFQWRYSVPNIIETDYYKDQVRFSNSAGAERRHYYLVTGAIYEVNRDLEIRPSTQLKVVQNAPIEVDLTVSAVLSERIWLGAMYRYHNAAGVLAAFSFTE